MKYSLSFGFCVCLLLACASAQSDYRNHTRFGVHISPHLSYYPRHYRSRHYRPQIYRHPHWHSGLSLHIDSHSGSKWGYLLGGAIIGNLLSQPRYSESRNDIPAHSHHIIETRNIEALPAPAVGGRRHLLRDAQGRCFDVQYNPHGEEIRREVPAQTCFYAQ